MNIPFLDRQSPRRTVQIVVVFVLLLFALAYQYAFKNTWQLHQDQQTNVYAELDPVDIARRIRSYESQLANLDETLGAQEYQRNLLFEKCNQIAAEFNLKLTEFAAEKSYPTESGVERILNEVHLKGNFEDIVRFIYVLEEEEKQSRVVSTTYLTRKNIRTKQTFLTAVLTLENFRLNS